jgi:predicted protein tyrosine phosphatase
LHRSPTAELLYARSPGLRTRSAGLSDLARTQVTVELLAWADQIFVMEPRLLRLLSRRFAAELQPEKVIGLQVPDDFQFQQPQLIALLAEQLTPHLGSPS